MVHNDYLLKQFAILLMNLRDGLQPTGYVPGAPASLPARGSWAFAGRDAGAPGVAHADDCSVCRQPICQRWAIHSPSRRHLPGFGQRMRRSAETPLRPQGVEIVPRLSGSSPEKGKQVDNRRNRRAPSRQCCLYLTMETRTKDGGCRVAATDDL